MMDDARAVAEEITARAAAYGISPLEYILAALRDAGVEPARLDEIAKAAALHFDRRIDPNE
jgi:hypothetical protein